MRSQRMTLHHYLLKTLARQAGPQSIVLQDEANTSRMRQRQIGIPQSTSCLYAPVTHRQANTSEEKTTPTEPRKVAPRTDTGKVFQPRHLMHFEHKASLEHSDLLVEHSSAGGSKYHSPACENRCIFATCPTLSGSVCLCTRDNATNHLTRISSYSINNNV